MAISFLQLFAAKLVNNAAADTLFTVAASPTTNLARNVRVRFANVTALAATIKAWVVPPAGAAADANVCLPTVSILANSYIDVDVPVMVAGAFMQAQAGTVSSITVTMLDGFIQS